MLVNEVKTQSSMYEPQRTINFDTVPPTNSPKTSYEVQSPASSEDR